MNNFGYLQKLAITLDFPGNIPLGEVRKFMRLSKTIQVPKNGFFLMAGEIPCRFGVIRKGLMRLYYIDRNSLEITKHFCIENTFAISYSAFLLRKESQLYIQALEDTVLRVLDYHSYRELVDGHVCWEIAVRKLTEMLYILKEKREAELLLNDAQERYLLFREEYPHLENRVAQYHIASYLGITPESLSRIRSSLKKE